MAGSISVPREITQPGMDDLLGFLHTTRYFTRQIRVTSQNQAGDRCYEYLLKLRQANKDLSSVR